MGLNVRKIEQLLKMAHLALVEANVELRSSDRGLHLTQIRDDLKQLQSELERLPNLDIFDIETDFLKDLPELITQVETKTFSERKNFRKLGSLSRITRLSRDLLNKFRTVR